MSYDSEVDQSGRIEFTKEDTVLALSDGVGYTILIPSIVKRSCVRALRRRGFSGPTFYIQLFAVALFFLLKGQMEGHPQIAIDVEYEGKEAQIKEHLLNLLHRDGVSVERDQITFRHIGKKSPAHMLSLDTLRGRKEASRTLTEADLLGQFRG